MCESPVLWGSACTSIGSSGSKVLYRHLSVHICYVNCSNSYSLGIHYGVLYFVTSLWGGHLSPSGNFIDSGKEVVVEDSISYARGCSKSVKKNPFFFLKERD